MSGKRGFWLKRARKHQRFATRTANGFKYWRALSRAAYSELRAWGEVDLTFCDWLIDEQSHQEEIRQDYYAGIAAGLIGG